MDDATAGRGAAVLIAGEPGIGKTRVCQESAVVGAQAGFGVYRAACFQGDGVPAFWPWIQLIRACAADLEPQDLASIAGSVIGRLVPEVAKMTGSDTSPSGSLDAQHLRFELFDAVTGLFRRLASRRPVMVVVDDLHWADASSVELLRFASTTLHDTRLLVLGAYRPAEADTLLDPPISNARVVDLRGLSVSETGELLESVTSTHPDDRLVRTVHERSGGNPLFVRELGRLLVASGRTADPAAGVPPVPTGVRAVIEQRTSMLPPACRELIEIGSVAGAEFTIDVVAAVAGIEPRDALDLLADAERAGILVTPDWEPGARAFTHGLVRDSLYERLPAARRADLHRAVADSLEACPPADRHASQLADHLARAGGHADLERALTYEERAAFEALEMLAFDEASKLFERALASHDRVDPSDDRRRARLLLGLGDARHYAGETAEARSAFLGAAEAARVTGDAEVLARAAVGFSHARQFAGGVAGADVQMVALLEEALGSPAYDDALRSLVLARLASQIVYVDPDRHHRLADEALALARAAGDPTALTEALETKHGELFGDDRVTERLALTEELIRLGETYRDAQVRGRIWRVVGLLELGDLRTLDQEIAACERLVEDARLEFYRWFPALWRAMRAVLEARLDDAETLAGRALELGEAQGQGALDHYGMQLIAIRREQDRIGELVPLIRDAADRYPEIPAYRCALAVAYAESGASESARAILDRLGSDRFAAIPRDYNQTVSLVLLAEACAAIGDTEHARDLYDRCLPFEQRFVNIGYASVCGGAVAHYLGMLARTGGRLDEAERHLTHALDLHRRIGAPSWSVRTQYELALVARDRGDHERADALLAEAATRAAELGLAAIGRRIEAARSAGAPADANVFRTDGESWSVTFAGRTAVLKSTKGMRDLARLLAAPGREIHALDLASPEPGNPALRAAAGAAVIDERARREYRARIAELHQEIDDARAANDDARAERASVELEELTAAIASAYGLGGKTRTAPDAAERARKAVTERIRDALKRIRAAHPELGDHLDRSVNTGTFCSYTPDRPIRWNL